MRTEKPEVRNTGLINEENDEKIVGRPAGKAGEKMIWTVKRIQEDDYGCEERAEDAKATVLVTLVNEKGQERLIRVEDDWLYANGIDEGDRWPGGISTSQWMCGGDLL